MRLGGEPWIVDRGTRRLAVVRTVGDPRRAARRAVPTLYRAVYTLKLRRKHAGADFPIEPLRVRWPNAETAPREEWVGLWGLPVPDDVEELPGLGTPVALETWEYGPTAEIVHAGGFATGDADVLRLRTLVSELGYEPAGALEEEYLTRPGSAKTRTVIRYPVRRRR